MNTMAPLRKQSNTKKHFENKDSVSKICKHCKQLVKTCGNTSNLKKHLMRKHPAILLNDSANTADSADDSSVSNENELPLLPSKSQNFASQKNSAKITNFMIKHSTSTDESITKAIMFMIAYDYQPFSIVNDYGFRQLLYILKPDYKIPSDTYFRTTMLPATYEILRNKLIKCFESIQYVSLTTDIWTSQSMDGYLAVTCHFVYKHELRTVSLNTELLKGSHTGEAIKVALQNVTDRWNITDKVVAIVTDNGSAMIKACELFKKKHMPCFAHTLQLIVADSLKDNAELSAIIEKCKKIVGHFRHSALATSILENEFRNAKKPYVKLKQEVVTRWGSLYEMIRRILNASDALTLALIKSEKGPEPLNLSEKHVLEDVISILTPINDATKIVSGSSYVSISLIIPIIFGIEETLKKLKTKTDASKIMLEKMKQSIVNRLYTYETRSISKNATLLDPRFKKLGFRNTDNASQAQTYLQNEVRILNASLQNEAVSDVSLISASEINTDGTSQSGLLAFLDERLQRQSAIATPTSDAIIIMRQYLQQANIDKTEDPLQFWKFNSNLNPLPTLAYKYFCVPATSVPSEEIFSKAGYILNERRNRLKGSKVDKLIFLKKNQWVQNEF